MGKQTVSVDSDESGSNNENADIESEDVEEEEPSEEDPLEEDPDEDAPQEVNSCEEAEKDPRVPNKDNSYEQELGRVASCEEEPNEMDSCGSPSEDERTGEQNEELCQEEPFEEDELCEEEKQNEESCEEEPYEEDEQCEEEMRNMQNEESCEEEPCEEDEPCEEETLSEASEEESYQEEMVEEPREESEEDTQCKEEPLEEEPCEEPEQPSEEAPDKEAQDEEAEEELSEDPDEVYNKGSPVSQSHKRKDVKSIQSNSKKMRISSNIATEQERTSNRPGIHNSPNNVTVPVKLGTTATTGKRRQSKCDVKGEANELAECEANKLSQLRELAEIRGNLKENYTNNSKKPDPCNVCGDTSHPTSSFPLIAPIPGANSNGEKVNFAEMGSGFSPLNAPPPLSVCTMPSMNNSMSLASRLKSVIDDANLYVGCLPQSVDDNALIELFSPFGLLSKAYVIRDKSTKISKGYGFVMYADRMSADKAVAQMNGVKIDGKVLAVRIAPIPGANSNGEKVNFAEMGSGFSPLNAPPPLSVCTMPSMNNSTSLAIRLKSVIDDANLYVGCLPQSVDDNAFVELFSPFGLLSKAYVIRDKSTKISKGYGFVMYADRMSADKAVAQMNGVKIDGKVLVVRIAPIPGANSNGEKVNFAEMGSGFSPLIAPPPLSVCTMPSMNNSTSHASKPKKVIDDANLFVGCLPQSVDDNALVELFSPFGLLSKAHVIRDKSTKISKGYGFVMYADRMSADKAVAQMNGVKIDGKVLNVRIAPIPGANSNGEKVNFAEMGSGFSRLIAPPPLSVCTMPSMNNSTSHASKPKKVIDDANLFVGCLPQSVDDNALVELFSPFGLLSKAYVIRDKSTKISKGYGFVMYADRMSADKAVAQMNGLKIDGKVLNVRIAPIPGANSNGEKVNFAEMGSGFSPLIAPPPLSVCTMPSMNNSTSHASKPKKVIDDANLFVGCLPQSVDDNALVELFSPFGLLSKAHVIRDKSTKISKGYGFVMYADRMSADKAVAQMNGVKIDGKVLNVRIAPIPGANSNGEKVNFAEMGSGFSPLIAPPPLSVCTMPSMNNSTSHASKPKKVIDDANLFVGCLPQSVDDNALIELFSPFGLLSKAYVIRDKSTKISKGYGFVMYADRMSADKAVAQMNGVKIDGKVLAVQIGGTLPPSHINQLPSYSGTSAIAQNNRRPMYWPGPPESRLPETVDSLSNINGEKVNFAEMGSGFSPLIAPPPLSVCTMPSMNNSTSHASKPKKVIDDANLFVGCLPQSVDDNALVELFSPFGLLSKAYVIRDKSTKISKGYGFVMYADRMSADKAVAQMNGVKIDGKVLAVQIGGTLPPSHINQLPSYSGTSAIAQNNRRPMYWPGPPESRLPETVDSLSNINGEKVNFAEMGSGFSPLIAPPPLSVCTMPSMNNSTSHASKPKKVIDDANLFVGCLPQSVDDNALVELFSPFGLLSKAYVIRDKSTKISKGYGFVMYADRMSADKAVAQMNGVKIDGKVLAVQIGGTLPPSHINQLPSYSGTSAIAQNNRRPMYWPGPPESRLPETVDSLSNICSYPVHHNPFSGQYLGFQTPMPDSLVSGNFATSTELTQFPGYLKSLDSPPLLHRPSMPSDSVPSSQDHFIHKFGCYQMPPT